MIITVAHVPTERARVLHELGAKLTRAPRSLRVVLALAAAMLVAAVALLLQSSQTHPASGAASATQRASTAAVAPAFGYPHRCLSIAISAADPDHASARVDRSGACAHYRGYVNASFHRVDGVWTVVRDDRVP